MEVGGEEDYTPIATNSGTKNKKGDRMGGGGSNRSPEISDRVATSCRHPRPHFNGFSYRDVPLGRQSTAALTLQEQHPVDGQVEKSTAVSPS